MRKRTWLTLSIVICLLMAVGVSVAAAQSNGAIRGTVYEDLNADGICAETTDPALAGVTLEFVTDSGAVVTLSSGDDGTYGMVAAGHGTWRVTAKPGDGFLVTSEQTKTIVIGTEQPEVSGVDFCVARVTVDSGGGAVVLPESGAGLATPLMVAAVIGLALMAAGAGLLLLQRRSTA